MHIVNIHEAKTHLSRLLEEVAQGQEILIAKAGKPIAKLGPIDVVKPQRHFGGLKGKIKITDDFDAPLPENVLVDFGDE